MPVKMSATEVICIASGKGGTGKTLIAASLCFALRKIGHRVLAIDADIGTDGLSLFLLGKDGTNQILSMQPENTLVGVLKSSMFESGIKWDPVTINRASKSDHGVTYDAIISSRSAYGDLVDDESLDGISLSTDEYNHGLRSLLNEVCTSGRYDYVVIDTRGGFGYQTASACALADGFVLVTEADFTSFYQDVNIVGRVNEVAKLLGERPQLRGIIVNKCISARNGAIDGSGFNFQIDLQEMEESFRNELARSFDLRFTQIHPVPLDLNAITAYKRHLIPFIESPATDFSVSLASAFASILGVVLTPWDEEKIREWNVFIELIEDARERRHAEWLEHLDRQNGDERSIANLATQLGEARTSINRLEDETKKQEIELEKKSFETAYKINRTTLLYRTSLALSAIVVVLAYFAGALNWLDVFFQGP